MKTVSFLLRFWAVSLFLSWSSAGYGQVFDMVVAQDGSGDYTSIQRAINKVPLNQSKRTLIYVKAGIYEEKVRVHASHKNVSLIGEAVDLVTVVWDDYSGDEQNNSTTSSYTFWAEGDGFYAENITFKNAAGPVGQAVALSTTGDQQVFKNCRLLGFQDTYYARKGRQYLLDCYIEGATDFIFGEATAVFESCEIKCLPGGQYITAPADTKLITEVEGQPFYHGLLFLNSQVSAADGVGSESYFLGRPWQPNASAVYIHSTLGDHIKKEGWSTWSDNNHETGFFAEYQSMAPTGEPVDVSDRVNWCNQLTKGEVENYYNLAYFLDGWDPLPITITPEVPRQVEQDLNTDTGFRFGWSDVEDAIGYVVYRNGSTLGFSISAHFEDSDAKTGDVYTVRTVGVGGNLSHFSDQVEALVVSSTTHDISFTFQLKDRQLVLSEPLDLEVYNLSGHLLIKNTHVAVVDISHFHRGIYLVKLENKQGDVVVKKIAL